VTALILQYEQDFFDAAFCADRHRLEGRLSKDFVEYGKSGAEYTRDETIRALSAMADDKRIEITRFSLTRLGEDVLLARYVSYETDAHSYARRTSLWRLEDGEWKLFFHQGTPCGQKA